jgi:tRNA (guanine37-N1)-methyltransferase
VTLEIDVVTLFPAMLEAPLAESIPGRIREEGLATVRLHDLRQWGLGKHRSVDDAPYGGGAGMVLRPEPAAAAIDALRRPDSTVILMDPGGRRFDQSLARDLAERTHLLLVCPRYEGVDDRVRRLVDLELTIGDYVLTGGEIPALVVIDAVIRLLPGAIDPASTLEESFSHGLLEYPQYTRPSEFRGEGVPEVLVGGNHEAIRRWRLEAAVRRTLAQRPDLLEPAPSDPETAAVVARLRSDA